MLYFETNHCKGAPCILMYNSRSVFLLNKRDFHISGNRFEAILRLSVRPSIRPRLFMCDSPTLARLCVDVSSQLVRVLP